MWQEIDEEFSNHLNKKFSRACLCQITCFAGGLQKDSGLFSSKMKWCGRWLRPRASGMYNGRYRRIVFARFADGTAHGVDWVATEGCFKESLHSRPSDGAQRTFLLHVESGLKVDVTEDFPLPLVFASNWDEMSSEVIGKYGNPVRCLDPRGPENRTLLKTEPLNISGTIYETVQNSFWGLREFLQKNIIVMFSVGRIPAFGSLECLGATRSSRWPESGGA